MHAISKPNAPDARSCASKRGILVQSCIAKALHRAFRGQFVSHWCRHSLPLQVGGKVGCSANFGHLVSRAVLHFARVQHMSAGLLFLDLASAYYAVIRETVVGGGLSDLPIAEVAKALELSPDDLQYLAHLVDSEPILHTQKAHPALTALAREVHAQTWFAEPCTFCCLGGIGKLAISHQTRVDLLVRRDHQYIQADVRASG